MNHLDERDLMNFARDELGARKKAKVIEHCKQCPECADRLIDAAREHAPDPGPFKLNRFQKISIAVMVLALVGVIIGMIWFFRQLGESAQGPLEFPELPAPEQGAPPPEPQPQGERGAPPEPAPLPSDAAAASAR